MNEGAVDGFAVGLGAVADVDEADGVVIGGDAGDEPVVVAAEDEDDVGVRFFFGEGEVEFPDAVFDSHGRPRAAEESGPGAGDAEFVEEFMDGE